MTTWTNERHAAACAATDDVSKATDNALLDGLKLRMTWFNEKQDLQSRDDARYTIGVLLDELSKRYA